MGNQQCIGCEEKVPKWIKCCDFIEFDYGRTLYERLMRFRWTKTSKGYICADCFKKRQTAEKKRTRQREIQRKQQEQLEAERHRQEELAKQEREREAKRKQAMEIWQRPAKNVDNPRLERHTSLSKSSSNLKSSFSNRLSGCDKTSPSLDYEARRGDFPLSSTSSNSNLQQSCVESEKTDDTESFNHSDSENVRSEREKSKGESKCGEIECIGNDDILKEVRFQKGFDNDMLATAEKVLSEYNHRIQRYENKYYFERYWYRMRNNMNVFRIHEIKCISDYRLAKYIFKICFAVKISKGFWPRNTQVISLLIFIRSFFKGKILEIKTGEGKTCTIAMFAAFLGLSGFSVDIVSSSPILAKRDLHEWKDFYKLFLIDVDCNLLPNDNNERIKCYEHQIVYGTVGSFASDILREEFLMEKVRGDRKLQVVIVDEVDCMLLDQGVNSTYLSNSIPGLHRLEPVLLMIWAQVIRHPAINSEEGAEYFCGNLEPFYLPLCRLSSEEMLSDPLHILEILESNNLLNSGFTKRLQQEGLEHMEAFKLGGENVQNRYSDSVLNYVTEECILACLEFMEKIFNIRFEPFKIVDENTIAKCKYVSENKDGQILRLLLTNQGYVCPLYETKYKVIEVIKRNVEEKLSSSENENTYEIPTHLFLFVNNRLNSWIENAFIAKYMNEGREYLVREREIVPVDFESTGVVELNTKWGDCLHQFLELKHEKRISQLTIETNFMSNQTFFKRYRRKIFGVTGTLGTYSEIEFLERTYGLTCLKIPTYCRNRFTEIEPLLCSTRDEWQSHIAQIVADFVEIKRAVLVICEDINTAKLLQANIAKKESEESVILYTRNDMNDRIPEKLQPTNVIISTNIAGRGTDIEVDTTVENAGGLFVLVTFFPSNERVEKQIFGRCARKGLPGSAQLVINSENLPGYFNTSIPEVSIQILRDYRAWFEQKRIQELEKRDLRECLDKEELFECYCNILNTTLEDVSDNKNMQIICRNYLHEWWGIWLKKNFNTHDACKLKEMLERDFKEVSHKLFHNQKSPTENVAHIVNLANEYFTKGEYVKAKDLYSEAISMNEKCSSIAYYQRAYCLIKKSQSITCIDEAVNDLYNAKKYLVRDKHSITLSITLFNLCRDKKNDAGNCETLQQFGIRCQLLHFIDENISMTLKSLKEMKSQRKKPDAKGDNILTLAFGETEICKMVDTEVFLLWELGLTEIMTVSEKVPFCWKGLVVSLVGVSEIAVGTFLFATSAGILANIGTGLIAEGVNDICTGSHAMLTKNNDFVKSWMVGKAVSIATSVATSGYSQIKSATSGVSGCKNVLNAVKNQIKNGASELLQNVKSIPKIVTSITFRETFRGTCAVVAKDVGKQLTKRGAKFLLNETESKLKKSLNDIARGKIKEEVRIIIFEGKLKNILNCVLSHSYENGLDVSSTDMCVKKKFENLIKSLLVSKDMPQVRQLILGCLCGICKYAEENVPIMNELSVSESIVGILKSVSTCTYDMRTLVQYYCTKMEEEIKVEFSCFLNEDQDQALAISEESEEKEITTINKYIKEKKTILVDLISSHILKLLQETLDFTCSYKIAGKFQSVVGCVVSHYVSEHKVGQDMIQTILSLSLKTLKDTELVTHIQNLTEQFCPEEARIYFKLAFQTMKAAITIGDSFTIEQVFEHGLLLAENAANTFSDEKTKVRINSFLKISKYCLNVYQQNGNASSLLKEGMDILQNGIDTFCPEHAAKYLAFGVKTIKVVLSVRDAENVVETLVHGLQLAEDAVSIFSDEKTKSLATFLLNFAKNSLQTFHSDRNASELLNASLNILHDWLDNYDIENSGKCVKFGVQTVQFAITLSVENRQSVESTLAYGVQLVEDAVDTIADEKTKTLTKFLLKVVKDGVKAFSFIYTQWKQLQESLEILQEGLDCFGPDDARKFLTFSVKTMKMVLADVKDTDVKEVFEHGLQLAEDAVNTFTNETTKKLFITILSITKIDVQTLQPDGKPSELLRESLDILHGKIRYEDSKNIITFGVKTMKIALSIDNHESIKEMFSYGLQLTEDAVDTFTNKETKLFFIYLVNEVKEGAQTLHTYGNPSQSLKRRLCVLLDEVKCWCMHLGS